MRIARSIRHARSEEKLHLKKRQRVPSTSLDSGSERGIIFISPPIRFRIEWAGSQRIVTALWQSAHFDFPARVCCRGLTAERFQPAQQRFRRLYLQVHHAAFVGALEDARA